MKRALISVSDKNNVVNFAKQLKELGYEIVSTGGTKKELLKCGIDVTSVSDITGCKEILEGRVKTLHPKIHGGLLADRNNPTHVKDLLENDIQLIDILVVNLYPYEKEKTIEFIDIGGPAMLRAAAKNFQFVTVVIDPNDYQIVINEIKDFGNTSVETRAKLAVKVFEHTSKYDSIIADELNKSISNSNLRYGENPHQTAFYQKGKSDVIQQIHGKELSYNNYLDIDAAIKTISNFKENTIAILKHTNPCGIASDKNLTNAYYKALATDNVSAFGGIVIANDTVDIESVMAIDKVFTEIVIAPNFTEEALTFLKKKKDRRVILYNNESLNLLKNHQIIQTCLNGYLHQMPDMLDDNENEWTVVTNRKPDEKDFDEIRFAWQVVKMLKSNAICFTAENRTLALGIGQTSRIDSLNIAIDRSMKMNLDLTGSVCASDGFFPFRDSIDTIAKYDIKCVIQPGGSKSDNDVIAACNEHNIVMVFTNRRHFRH